MKLSKLYSNYPTKFPGVEFRDGLNVVLGKIKAPTSRDRDTHNLGKTLFAQVIDFCLLKGVDPEFFLFKNSIFEDFVFFLEVKTHRGEYVTIRRSVRERSKGAFKKHSLKYQDFTHLSPEEWDHWNLPFEASRQMLDGILDLAVLKPWSYRNAVSYSLRSQKDYDEPFKLAKHAGSHAEWKPFLSHILGFDSSLVSESYAVEEAINKLEAEEKQLAAQVSGVKDLDQLRGQVQIVEKDITSIEAEVERFDFAPADERATRQLVATLDSQIVHFNERRYSLRSDRARIEAALDVRLSIDLKSLESLYRDSKVYFGDQVKKDYVALERFNKEIAEERDTYLRQDLQEIDTELADLSAKLDELNRARASTLELLADESSLSKYKQLTRHLVELQAGLQAVKQTESILNELSAKRADIRGKKAQLDSLRSSLDATLKSRPRRYEDIRQHFDEVVSSVIDHHANLFSRINKAGHLEFDVDILDDFAKPSNAAEGFSYGRLLCIAFDLAIMKAYIAEPFPHFVFHDGLLETLDDRKKLNLIEVSRDCCECGIQHIVTAIESELPLLPSGKRFSFDTDEVILSLSDEGDAGRLFKMPAW